MEVVFGDSTGRIRTLTVDSAFFHYLRRELTISTYYRRCFEHHQKCGGFRFILLPTQYDLIDYNWNERVFLMVRERCELDHALSWLSTLGGAFSALGDYFANCALTAGKISLHQFKLALRLGDPLVASRCRLYYALSLIQQHRFKLAKFIILNEYEMARNALVIDEKLIRMCKGIWAKLQYEHRINRCRKKL